MMYSSAKQIFITCCFLLNLSPGEPHVFFCDFESNSTCGIENGSPVDPQPPPINFTIRSPQTVTYSDLGPFIGRSFFYWSRPDDSPHAEEYNGRIHTPKFHQIDGTNMCVQFTYYIKSTGTDNGTWLDVSTGGCYASSLFFVEQDDSKGWQTITIPLHEGNCSISLYFTVNQRTPVRVALAFDDIIVDWCDTLIKTTTTHTSATPIQVTISTLFLVTLLILIFLK
ncbi:hypothetical protein I4U23_019911 [Adineta vaga]|nr:hypothetical protein I4U23_019911 [Adineta vaga]